MNRLLLFAVLLTACSSADSGNFMGPLVDGVLVGGDPYQGWEPQGTPAAERTWVNNDLQALAERVVYPNAPVPLSSPFPKADGAAAAVALTLVAQVEPPSTPGHHPADWLIDENGEPHHNEPAHDHDAFALQASTVRIVGDTVIVSYHMAGEVIAGVVEVVDISDPTRPVLVSSAGFDHMDFASVNYYPDGDDGRSGWVYVAAGTCDPRYQPYTAVVEQFRIDDQQIEPAPSYRFGVPGASATGVAVNGDSLIVASGDFGGLTAIDRPLERRTAFASLNDVRWVELTEDVGVVLTGSATYAEGEPASLRFYDPATLEPTGQVDFEGLDVAYAKGTVSILGRQVWAAAGKAGMKVFGLDSRALLAEISLPGDTGYAPDEVATNSVTAEGGMAFMANGALGVWVVIAEPGSAGVDAPLSLQVAGSFDSAGSVNHVAFGNGILALASGAEGLQLISVE